MKCFNCGYELNKKGAEQCQICGVKFEHSCNSCGAKNPTYAKFCIECGTDLQLDSQVKLEETKRQVAVLFADVSGFTSLSEKLDPEKVREIINETFQFITRPVYELEGTIDKYIGDCVMVLFGAKYAHKDDSARAVKCALEMQRLIQEFNQEKLAQSDIELNLSIGINFGVVVTGQVGNYYDKDYTVIGDVVNTAQRLQANAPAGDIYVSESIFLDTADIADYHLPIDLKVKNKEGLVKAYQPVSIKSITEATMFIERTEELSVLNDVFVSDRKMVNITGESGLGKTSLVKEFLSTVDDSLKRVWINTSAVQKNKPFSLISKIINEVLNIKPEDSLRVRENRMRSFLDYIMADETEEAVIRNYNFIALITGLQMDDDYKSLIHSMEYKDIRTELSNQIQIFFDHLSQKQFIIVTIEDVDLGDQDSLNMLNHIHFEQIMGILISQSKLEEVEMVELELKRFNMEQTRKLMKHIIKSDLDDETVNDIYEYSKGNPMLVSELISSARRKGLVKSINPFTLSKESISSLPTTMSGLILSKLEDLSEKEVELLKIASIIGDEFKLSWIERNIEFDETLITKLVNSKFIEFRRVVSSNKETKKVYGFSQKIIKDVLYNDLLEKSKIKFHKIIGNTIEDLEEVAEYYEVLAMHFEMAENTKKASNYNYLYANELVQSYNYNSAIKHLSMVSETSKYYPLAMKEKASLLISLTQFDQAIESLKIAETLDESDEFLYEVKLLKASLYREQALFDECLVLIDELEDSLPEKSNLMGKVLRIKTAVYLMTGRPEVIDIALKSEKILTSSRDYSSLADTISYAGIASFMRGKPDDAIMYLQKGLDYANLSNNITAISRISSNIGNVYHAMGEVNKSFQYLNEAMDAANKVGSVKNYCTASINLGVFYMEKGRFTEAKSVFNETFEKAKNANLKYQQCISSTNLGDLYIELGEYDLAMENYRLSLEIAKEFSLKYEEGVTLLGIAKIKLELGEDGEDYLEEANSIFEETEELMNVSDYYRVKAEFLDYSVDTIDKAIEYAKKAGSELKQLQALAVKGVLTKDELFFTEAIRIAKNIESTYEEAKVLYKKYVTFNDTMLVSELKNKMKELDDSLLKERIFNI